MRIFKSNTCKLTEGAYGALAGLGGVRSKMMVNPVIALSVAMSLVFSGAAFANDSPDGQPLNIDDLGFSGVMNDRLFTNRIQVSGETAIEASQSSIPSIDNPGSAGFQLTSMMELESQGPSVTASGTGFDLDSDQLETEDGFRIRRFSTSVQNSVGTLTVGNDWSNFQDFLGNDNSVLTASETVALGGVTANQVKWKNGKGLGVALEQGFTSSYGEEFQNDDQSPSLVLSWEGESKSGSGQYRMSALGHQVEPDQSVSDEDKDIGWGLNLAGGWRFGDLFAKLSLTLGNSIDSFILGRSNKSSSQSEKAYSLNEAFSISPSINYQLTDKGNIHFSVNRFQSSEELSVNGVDTLDTVHLGYSWTPWSSTRFGIEYVGKDVEGNTDISDSNEVNFAASKEF